MLARPLEIWERDGLKAALARAGLPIDDIAEQGPLFWRFEQDDMPVGFGGLECHGRDAILRSLVTLPPLRRRGFGRAMVEALEVEARMRGCRSVYLLTSDSAIFERLGYLACRLDDAPAAIRASRTFMPDAPANSVAMMKSLA